MWFAPPRARATTGPPGRGASASGHPRGDRGEEARRGVTGAHPLKEQNGIDMDHRIQILIHIPMDPHTFSEGMTGLSWRLHK